MDKIICFGAGVVFTVFVFAAVAYCIAKEDMDDLADEPDWFYAAKEDVDDITE